MTDKRKHEEKWHLWQLHPGDLLQALEQDALITGAGLRSKLQEPSSEPSGST